MTFEPPLKAGPSVEEAGAALLLIHGRGAPAEGMLHVYEELNVPWCAALAPQAAGNSWYPKSFLASLESNQPFLDQSLAHVESIVEDLLARRIASNRIAILGFSQGACLTVELAARHPRRFGAIIGLTGGLIGPAGTPRNYPGDLKGTPVFLGSSDPDPHVPFARVVETKAVLSSMGAAVELRRYPGMAHTINEDELDACRQLLGQLKTP